MRKALVGLGIILLLVTVGYAYAHGPWYGPGYGPGQRPSYGPMHGSGYAPGSRGGYCREGGEKGASITPEQRSKFQELREKFNDETAPLRTSIFTKRQELQSLWSDPKADSNTILQKERELRDLQNQLREKATGFKLEARKDLTPEQLSSYRGLGMGSEYGPGHHPRYGRKYGRGPGYGAGPGSGSCY